MKDVSKLLDQAYRLCKAGDMDNAASLYHQVLDIDANNILALTNLGTIYLTKGNYKESVYWLKRTLALDRASVTANSNLGLILLKYGKYLEAAEHLLAALRKEPGHACLWNSLGDALLKSGQADGATECYQKAVKINPNYIDGYLKLGEIAADKKNSGKKAEAIGYFTKMLSLLDGNNLNSHYAISWLKAHLYLGKIALEEENLSKATAHFEAILTLKPNHLESHWALGEITLKQKKYQKSAAHYERVLLLDPKCEQACCDLIHIHYNERQNLDKAFYYINKALSINPDQLWTYTMLAELLILTGRWQEGFNRHTKNYPFDENQRGPIFQAFQPIPRWQGEIFSGKRLVIGPLSGFGGFGDIIMLSRYFPQVKERGGYVAVSLRRELLRLFENFQGIDEIFLYEPAEITAKVTPENFDLHIPLIFLPDIFGISLNNIPSKTPYLPIRSNLNNVFKKLMSVDNKLKVGLIWSCGNKVNTQRTCGIEVLDPLSSFTEVTYYSLQVGQPSKELSKYKSNLNIIDLTQHITDFADTADLIHNLDLVISVDTATAHLAGAMGKPVWLILPFVSDGKWLLDGNTTPWYPTMRIFRSKTLDNWSGVIEEICRHLHLVCQNRELLL